MEFYVILTMLGLVLFKSHAAPLSEKLSEATGENGNYFEGDMMLTAVQRAEIERAINVPKDGNVESRNGLVDTSKRWPKKTVVYHIKVDDFRKWQIEAIRYAISDIENKSCIKFRERESEDEYAVIIQGEQTGCRANVGYIGNERLDGQVINLASYCFEHGTILHEILHTLGFYHMQSTYDRDEYVTIIWKNIQIGMQPYFAKYTRSTLTEFGVPYDYGSVMHFARNAYSVLRQLDTIVPKQANVEIGQRERLSESDVLKLNKMYECP